MNFNHRDRSGSRLFRRIAVGVIALLAVVASAIFMVSQAQATMVPIDVGDIPIFLPCADISGNAGVAEASVSVAGRTVVSGSNGNYFIACIKPGSYSITVSKSGYAFSPATIPVVVANGSHATLTGNFVATASPPPAGTACDTAPGRVLLVGPGKTYATPSAAAAASMNGDVIKITAGNYLGNVAIWTASNLTICGVGGRAKLFANGNNAQGKAIWVIQGANVTLDNIEFHDAKVADRNGAGIRIEGMNLTIKNSGFYDNENGILGGSAGTVTIERSEFARNGYGDGQTHNIYIGAVDRLNVTESYFHEAKIGHNLKSRARQTYIENSYFMDGPMGTSSYLAEFPNGGVVYLRGNLFQKGPHADNPIAIAYGQEGANKPVNTLEMVHNTVVMTRSGGTFTVASNLTQSVKLTANLFAGIGSPAFFGGSFPLANIVQQGNVISAASNFSGADNIAAPNFWPTPALQAQIGLGNVPDPAYVQDSPRPYQLRAITAPTRVSGALQSAP